MALNEAQTTVPSPPGDVPPARVIPFGSHIEIDPSSPLDRFSAPHAPAFAARNTRSGNPLIAYLADPRRQARIETLDVFAQFSSPHFFRPIESGPVRWTEEGGWRFAIFYPRVEGTRLVSDMTDEIEPLSLGNLVRRFVLPTLDFLAECYERGVTHRGIRPTNLFVTDENSPFLLGDGVTVPPGVDQPVICEPVELAMADPWARGDGDHTADLYALGVTMLYLAIGKNPLAGMTSEQILDLKIREGSYNALVNGHRLPMGIKEALRGLLNDDPENRWTLHVLTKWAEGGMVRENRKSPRPSHLRSMEHGITVNGQEYKSLRALAHALSRDWQNGPDWLKTCHLPQWIESKLGDSELAGRTRELLQLLGNSEKSRADRSGWRALIFARLLATLDPRAPWRFLGIAAMPDALGDLVAERHADEAFQQDLRQFFEHKFFLYHAELPGADTAMASRVALRLKNLPAKLASREYGAGMEYCLYALNPELPCLSPMFGEKYHVISCETLIDALEEGVGEKSDLTRIFDRHLAAFVAARVRGLPDGELPRTEIMDSAGKRASLRILATAQRRANGRKARALSGWLRKFVEPTLGDLHNVRLRQYIDERLESAAASGNLSKLVDLLDNRTIRHNDDVNYRHAVQEARRAEAELNHFRLAARTLHRDARLRGQAQAGVVSLALSIAAGIGLFMMKML
ncbi:MAG: hypothetical protein RLP16_06420 [Alphaproteobacteria bacterium]